MREPETSPVDASSRTIPKEWGEGAFSGNGLVGFMAYAPEGHVMAWEIGRTDVMERREGGEADCDAFRLPIGRVVLLAPPGEGWLAMDPREADVRGAVGEVGFRSLTHAVHDAILIEIDGPGRLGFQPGYSMPLSVEYNRPIPISLMNPPPVVSYLDGRLVCAQSASPGLPYATIVDDLGGGRFLVAVGRGERPVDEAERILKVAREEGWDGLLESHAAWWHAYHAASSATLPDAKIQRHYDLQVYKLACATRADRPAMDLLGPWTFRTVWAATWWNLNIQLCYPPVYPANHPELGESFLRLLHEARPNFVENAAPWGDAAVVGRATDRDGLGSFEGEWCNLPWACQVAWRHWRYTMDEAVLRDDVLPLLRRCMNYYRHLLHEGVDGRLHLPTGVSPEYHELAMDTNINLALIRWGCGVLVGAGEAEWREVIDRLAPFPTDANGISIGAGVVLQRSHRHFSHLLAVYPLHLLDPDLEAERELIERSLAHWVGMDEEFVGYSYAAAASMYALLGKGDEALTMLGLYFERFGTPNTMYLEHGGWGAPTLETPLAVLSSVQEMLLQSHGSVLRLFPAVPTSWREVAFENWRAEGAFLVSAVRCEGETREVRLASLAGEPCRVRVDLREPVVEIDGRRTACLTEGRDLVIPLKRGEVAHLRTSQP